MVCYWVYHINQSGFRALDDSHILKQVHLNIVHLIPLFHWFPSGFPSRIPELKLLVSMQLSYWILKKSPKYVIPWYNPYHQLQYMKASIIPYLQHILILQHWWLSTNRALATISCLVAVLPHPCTTKKSKDELQPSSTPSKAAAAMARPVTAAEVNQASLKFKRWCFILKYSVYLYIYMQNWVNMVKLYIYTHIFSYNIYICLNSTVQSVHMCMYINIYIC